MNYLIYANDNNDKIVLVDATHDDYVIMRVSSRLYGDVDLYMERDELIQIFQALGSYINGEVL